MGIPAVHVCSLSVVAATIGSRRIFQGNSIIHPLGDPSLPPEQEYQYRLGLVRKALALLTE